MTEPTLFEKAVEAIAREMCKAAGRDPDHESTLGYSRDEGVWGPEWRWFEDRARAALLAALKVLRDIPEPLCDIGFGQVGSIAPTADDFGDGWRAVIDALMREADQAPAASPPRS